MAISGGGGTARGRIGEHPESPLNLESATTRRSCRPSDDDEGVTGADPAWGASTLLAVYDDALAHVYGYLVRRCPSRAVHLDMPDVDAFVAHALASGATLVREVSDQFHGNRNGVIHDPFRHRWMVSTRIASLTAEGVEPRAVETFREGDS
jgi:uncharacterized glyoxalase superfamily protein PhnB